MASGEDPWADITEPEDAPLDFQTPTDVIIDPTYEAPAVDPDLDLSGQDPQTLIVDPRSQRMRRAVERGQAGQRGLTQFPMTETDVGEIPRTIPTHLIPTGARVTRLPTQMVTPESYGVADEPVLRGAEVRPETAEERRARVLRAARNIESGQADLPLGLGQLPSPEALGTGALQGATLGFSEEIGAALSPERLRGMPYGELRDVERERQQALKQAAPISYGTGEAAGALATAVPALGAGPTVLGGRGVAGALARTGAGALEGALAGGLGGAGYSEAELGTPEFAEDVQRGAAFGGVAGGAFPAVLEGAGMAGRGLYEGARRGTARAMQAEGAGETAERFMRGTELGPEAMQRRALAETAREGQPELMGQVAEDVTSMNVAQDIMRAGGASIADKPQAVTRMIDATPPQAVAESFDAAYSAIDDTMQQVAEELSVPGVAREAGLGPADIRSVNELGDLAKQRVLEASENPTSEGLAEAFVALDRYKRFIQTRFKPPQKRQMGEELSGGIRDMLMDENLWGQQAAGRQRALNEAFTETLPRLQRGQRRFTGDIGAIRSEFDPYTTVREGDPVKMAALMQEPEGSLGQRALLEGTEAQAGLMREMGEFFQPEGRAAEALTAGQEAAARIPERIGQARRAISALEDVGAAESAKIGPVSAERLRGLSETLGAARAAPVTTRFGRAAGALRPETQQIFTPDALMPEQDYGPPVDFTPLDPLEGFDVDGGVPGEFQPLEPLEGFGPQTQLEQRQEMDAMGLGSQPEDIVQSEQRFTELAQNPELRRQMKERNA